MPLKAAQPRATDVLIVGAGPVGLFLACELIQRGHSVRIVEQHAGQSEHSKALAVMPRTMEIFDLAGIAKPFEQAAHRVTAASVISHQRELGRIPFAPHESRFPFVAMIGQDVTERLLLEALITRGGKVEYATEFIAAEQRGDVVVATLRGPAGEETCTARYLVGCDGAHSTVRRLANLPFEGAEYADTFVLLDVDTNLAVPSDEMQLCPNEHGPIAVFPMSDRRRRLVAMIDATFSGEPDLALANDILAKRGPQGLRAESLHWASTFRIHRRQVPAMRSGLSFLAGDAAHIHSPFGGQGMNTGLQDAANLAWKLDFTLRGWGTDELLQSYSAERHRIAQQVIRTTDALTRGMGLANTPAQMLRDAAIPVLTRLEPFRAFFVSTLSELGANVAHSPIVEGAGRRAPDEAVDGPAGATRLYELLDGRYLLLYPRDLSGEGAAALSEIAPRYGSAVATAARRDAGEPTVQLVRPDAYVAWEGSLQFHPAADLTVAISRILDTHLHA